MKTIGIIGLGLIGGSLGLDLSNKQSFRVLGFDQSDAHQQRALELSLVHEIATKDQLIMKSDVILLCIPVHQILIHLPNILSRLRGHQTVIDFGSTKENICAAVQNHPMRKRFVAAHPLAGTEFSGPDAAIRNLFQAKKNIICEPDRSDSDALTLAIDLFTSLGMETSFLCPASHDLHLAYVSHLSHVTSFTLALTVLDLEKDKFSMIQNLAGSGFASTARLAKSSPDTWEAILTDNASHILQAIDQYQTRLSIIKQLIFENQKEELKSFLHKANEIHSILS